MKMLLTVEMPPEPFNTLVRNGTVGDVLGRIMEELKPETVYFSELDGKRGCVCVVDVNNPSEVPKYAEPFFLQLNAEVRFRVIMSPQDLQKAGLEALGKKWG